jgi:hypothetical protein
MKRNTINPMKCIEFEKFLQKIVQSLGSDSIEFFTTIHDMEAFFLEAETAFKRSPLDIKEFEAVGKKIAGLPGEEESVRFFKAIYETISQKSHSLTKSDEKRKITIMSAICPLTSFLHGEKYFPVTKRSCHYEVV